VPCMKRRLGYSVVQENDLSWQPTELC